MLSFLLRLLAAKDVIKTVADAAGIAKSARDTVVELRQSGANRDLDREAFDKMFADLAGLAAVVADQARVLEQTSGQIERLAAEVRRAWWYGALGLAAGLVGLAFAIIALVV